MLELPAAPFAELSPESYIAFVQHPENPDDIQWGVTHAGNGGNKVVFVLNGQRVARREMVLGLGDDEWSLSFQSRVGRAEWLRP